jgi:hypothetical protein
MQFQSKLYFKQNNFASEDKDRNYVQLTTVQRKLTWVKSGINRQLMTCHCSDGYFFLI